VGLALPTAWYTDPAISTLELGHIFRRTVAVCRADRPDRPRQRLFHRRGWVIFRSSSCVPWMEFRHWSMCVATAVTKSCRARATVRRCSARITHGRTNSTADCGRRHAQSVSLTSAKKSTRSCDFQVATWGQWIFANADVGAPPLSEMLGELPRIIESSGINLDALRFWRREAWTSDANWKVMI
jgi:hypothetical protein